ncbi:DUF302 domain-containing protein [Dongia sp.]|uniref:DUF302 domain-containing protein n=1 Tax=Dongia sp. TaxID=1977262 RepID=UPI00375009B4
MTARFTGLCAAIALAAGLAGCAASSDQPTAMTAPSMSANGIVAAKSAYGMDETVARLKQDIAGKGLMFFSEIDQAKLAKDAGIAARPSTLLVFGNPALGTQFITANPQSGIDWPVRLLVYQDANGQVWTEYTDFHYVQARHGIEDRDAQFQKASEVIASITSSVAQ